jgi:4-hydroxybenzoyl-CoA reductase subunit beta
MKLPELELAYPASVADACRYLAAGRSEAQAIAGGTDLLVALKEGQKSPRKIVDLSNISGLDKIAYSPTGGLEIGALVTLHRVIREPLIRDLYPVIAQAAGEVGTAQLQAMATIGGNLCQDSCCMYFNRPEEVRRPLPPCHKLGGCICHVMPNSEQCWAPYAGDMAPVLIALGAQVTIANPEGEEIHPLTEIFSDDGAHPLKLEPGALITKIHCPSPAPHTGTAYFKTRPRETLDYAVAGVATSLSLDPTLMICEGASIVLTGVAASPKIVPEAKELQGQVITEEAIDRIANAAIKLSDPVRNVVGAEPGYRRTMVAVNVKRSLQAAFQLAAASMEKG